MQPSEFLRLAEALHATTAEAELRTSVSRSYYAVYNQVVDMLSSGSIPLQRDGRDHGRVAFYVANCGDRHVATVSGWLNNLRLSRNDADYDMRVAVDERMSEVALETARKAFRRLDSITPAQRPTLLARMRAVSLPRNLK